MRDIPLGDTDGYGMGRPSGLEGEVASAKSTTEKGFRKRIVSQ
jgi:hypothetical protein